MKQSNLFQIQICLLLLCGSSLLAGDDHHVECCVAIESPIPTKKPLPKRLRIDQNNPDKPTEWVVLKSHLTDEGVITDIKLLAGFGPEKAQFNQSAIDTLKQWRYLPKKELCKPVETTLYHRFLITAEAWDEVDFLDYKVFQKVETTEAFLGPEIRKKEAEPRDRTKPPTGYLVLPIAVDLDEKGHIKNFRMYNDDYNKVSSPSRVEELIADKLKNYLFAPPLNKGEPIPSEVSINVEIPLGELP